MVGHPAPDDVPKKGLFTEPVRVSEIRIVDPLDRPDGSVQVAFRVLIRDATDQRCSNVAVEARIVGPERTGSGTAVTDLMGRAEFRMDSTPGHYALEVLDVAAGGLDWDREASQLRVDVDT